VRYTNTGSNGHKLYVNHLLRPQEIYANFAGVGGTKGKRPVIIVTATGGGIHAAAWTAAVLAKLERKFHDNGVEFHNAILMMSTVSGGSVGVVPWAAEYLKDDDRFSQRSLKGMKKITRCSELQAVSWGLTYADFLRLVYPWRRFFWSQDLSIYDRGWAFQQAVWRNRHYEPCQTADLSVPSAEESVGDLAWSRQNLPAFSFNTTVAETGNRFLSANYFIPRHPQPDDQERWSEIMTADSFLDIYHRDLPLSSAARLSSTFPYVSPMPKVDIRDSRFHFGDGGYFDNDGTATALEFLWYAFADQSQSISTQSANVKGTTSNRQAHTASLRPGEDSSTSHSSCGATDNPCVPVLLIEIRDGGDVVANFHPEELKNQRMYNVKKGKEPPGEWGVMGQLLGPLDAFWNAGHVAVTKRNRRELCILEHALEARVRFSHIVLPYNGEEGEVHALSWHLTKKQQTEIDTNVKKLDPEIKAAADWYKAGGNKTPPPLFGCSHSAQP
jgi:hypothetical protein